MSTRGPLAMLILSNMIARLCVFSLVSASAFAQSWMDLPGSIYGPPPADPWGNCPAASWPVSNIGQQLQPQQPDSELQDMLGQIDPQRIQSIVTTLANFGTRHTLSTQTSPVRGIGAAREWIYRQMQTLAEPSQGNMNVYLNSYIQPVAERISFPVNISNVVAQINGTSDSNRVYVVTGLRYSSP